MAFEYINKYYNVPACIGRVVEIEGKTGIIVEDRGNYIGVVLDGDKPNDVHPFHPTHMVKYLGVSKPRKMTRPQLRYRRFLRYGDMFDDFMSFCRYEDKHGIVTD